MDSGLNKAEVYFSLITEVNSPGHGDSWVWTAQNGRMRSISSACGFHISRWLLKFLFLSNGEIEGTKEFIFIFLRDRPRRHIHSSYIPLPRI